MRGKGLNNCSGRALLHSIAEDGAYSAKQECQASLTTTNMASKLARYRFGKEFGIKSPDYPFLRTKAQSLRSNKGGERETKD